MPSSVIQRSFAAGELAPALHARADQVKYTTGLRTCRNFLVRREGGVSNRPGTRFVSAAKDNASGKLLLRYVSSTPGQSVLIEAGSGYFRFFLNGAAVNVSAVPAYNGATAYVPGDIVASGGVNYYCIANTTGNAPPNGTYWYALPGTILEIPTPYGGVAPLFKWNQSGNVITLTERGQKPRELVYLGPTHWILRDISTAPTVAAPSGGAGTPGAAGALTYRYKLTAAALDTYEESNPSATIVVAATAAPTQAAPIALTWTAQPTAAEFNVYLDPYGNDAFGYIGTTTTNSFNDTGLTPDYGLTPPLARVLFDAVNDYPETSAVHQQRRFFANTNHVPDGVWGSRVGFTSNFGISTPLQDDDAITFKVAGNNHHTVRWLVTLKAGLVLLTTGGEWTVTGDGGGGIKPNSIEADQHTYAGAHPTTAPAVVGNTVVYPQRAGRIINALRFDQQVEGLAGQDLTIFSTHLFKKPHTIVDLDFQQSDSIVWCCRSDGTLLGLTYIPEQEFWGWHRHDTGASGRFEDVCVVPEADRDVAYFLVRRTINGGTVRYIEKLEDREIVTWNTDVFFVDAGLSYSGAPATVFGGLGHLEGQVVAVVGDGVVVYDGDPAGASAATFTVTAGAITLPAARSNVHIGIPIRFAELEPLDLDVQGEAIRDKWKRTGSVTVIVDASARGFMMGPDSSNLTRYAPAPYESTAASVTGGLEQNVVSNFTPDGRFLLRHIDPLPLTVLGFIPNIELGG